MPDRAKRSLRTRLLATVLAPLLFLGLLELGLRVFGYSYDPTEQLAGQAEREELTRPEMYRPHPRWLWTVLPGTTLDVPEAGWFGVKTNPEGFRTAAFPTQPAEDEFRVLCLGDSVTFGLGLRAGETWPERLEAELRRRAGGRMAVRVLNAGVPGWSSTSAVRFLEDHPKIAPDVIVFWFGMNDAKEHLGVPDARIRPGGTGSSLAWLRRLRTVQLLRAFLGGMRRSAGSVSRVSPAGYRAAVETVGAATPHAVFVRYPEQVDRTIRQLETVIARAEAAGVGRVVGPTELLTAFAAAPPGADLSGTPIMTDAGPALRFSGRGDVGERTVAEIRRDLDRLRELDARFTELVAALPAAGPDYAELFGETPPDVVFHDNCHLRPAGAELAGKALADRIGPWLEAKIRGK